MPQIHRMAEIVSLTPEMRLSLFADTDAGLAELRTMAELADARVVDVQPCDARKLPDAFLGNLALVDLRGEPDDTQDMFLTLLDAKAEEAGARLIVGCTRASLDAVFARVDPDRTQILLEPDRFDRQLALSTASAATRGVVMDLSNEEGLRLQRLADEVGRIAKTLADLAEGDGSRERFSDGLVGFRGGNPFLPSKGTEGVSAEDIRQIVRLRRLREKYLPAELFADPAWDMLLDLMAARIEGTRVPVSSLCIAASVPPTTALRWIKTMTDRGLFVRVADQFDARRVFIELSDSAAQGMRDYLLAAKALGGLAV